MEGGVLAFVNGLKQQGIEPTIMLGKPDHVIFDYAPLTGKHAEEKIRQGVVVPSDFPASPPGGLHVNRILHPQCSNGQTPHPLGGIHASDFGGDWQYWSRPFKDWGKTKKTVGVYLSHIEHLWATQ